MERPATRSSLSVWMENPLQGSFNRERTVLVFRQRSLEAQAALWSLIGGGAMALFGLWTFMGSGGAGALWCAVVGTAFAAAGGWAFLMFRYLRFDLRKGTYIERAGSGLWVKWRTGRIEEINCLGLEAYHGLVPEMQFGADGWTAGGSRGYQRRGASRGQVFVVRLWWKDRSLYPPVLEHLYANRLTGGPDGGAATFYAKAQTFAHALGVPMFGRLN